MVCICLLRPEWVIMLATLHPTAPSVHLSLPTQPLPDRQAAFYTFESEVDGLPVPDGDPVPAVTKVRARWR